MATDFFDRQDNARRLTRRLVVMFLLAVVAIVLVVYLVAAVIVVTHQSTAMLPESGRDTAYAFHEPVRGVAAVAKYWDPVLFVWVSLGTLAIIALGSLLKIAELSSGGETVALMLGGRPIDPQTRDLAERRLLNIVEEMALASGVPVPPVFVLDNEPSINAFAAGHQPGNAVVAVSAGCLQYLNREELQGVMGHEFSHILNGDMRLNLRLIGMVYGILVLAIVGYYAMRMAGSSSSRSSKDNGGQAAFVLLGLALYILGYIGVFFGNLIKAAINRQREFLADASAVQFTRNPGGIAGALKKIGGLVNGSRIRDAHAEEVSHMFFGNAFAGSFLDLFATHPPLEQRIRALEPEFDGSFPQVSPLATSAIADQPAGAKKAARRAPMPIPLPIPPGLPGGAAIPYVAAGLDAPRVVDADNAVQQIGRLDMERLDQAADLLVGLPQGLSDAAHEPFSAQALVFVLLLSQQDETVRSAQLQLLQWQIEPELYKEVVRLAATAQSLPAEARLPLVDLAIPALKRSSPQQYARFRQVVDALVNADQKVELFEYCLRIVLLSYLDVPFGVTKPPKARYLSVNAVAQPMAAVLSTLAYVGHTEPDDVQRAFEAGARGVVDQAAPLPMEQCTLDTFDAALGELAQASPSVKRRIVAAVTACISTDGKVTMAEGELLRAVAAVLACPMPPMVGSAGSQ